MQASHPQMTVGEYVSHLLARYGIGDVFGIPGVHTIELYRGLKDAGLNHVTPRHEQGAGFMADGYARATGRPAACYIITGPGMTNIATALAQARADSVPMLVISSVNNTHDLGRGEGRLHELPSQQQVLQGLVSFSHTVLHEDELPQIIGKAFAVFNSARPAPVHIEIPVDVLARPAGHLPLEINTPSRAPMPNPADIAHAVDLLKTATDPFVILGGGAQNAPDMAAALVKHIAAPALLTINAKGVLPKDNPLNAGSALCVPSAQKRLADADVILAIGTELAETDTLLFGQRLHLNGKVIRIDIDPAQLSSNVLPSVSICADAGLAMQALCQALPNTPADASHAHETVQQLRQMSAAALGKPDKIHQRMFRTIDATLDTPIIVGDSTQPIYSANSFYDASEPRSYFNSTTGYGTLGYALPAAIGARIALPDRPVVCIIGDGGLLFSIGELASAVEQNLNIVIIVWNNSGYGEIAKFMQQAGVAPVGVDLFTPDFNTIALGFGCAADRPKGWSAFESCLKNAQGRSKPSVIIIDETDVVYW